MKNNIKAIFSIIHQGINSINTKLIKRNRSISYKDIFYLLCMKNFSGQSYDNIISSMKIKGLPFSTKTSFIKKRNLLDHEDIININKNLLQYIYKDSVGRLLAIDGTHGNIDKRTVKNGFKLSDNGHYVNALMSCIYDIKNRTVINYNLNTHNDERLAFKNQLNYIREGDTLIFDRGYYSEDLVQTLVDKKVKFIFRMKKDSKMVKLMNVKNLDSMETSIKHKKNIIPLRILSYKIDMTLVKDKDPHSDGWFYMCTNLTNESIKNISEMYNDRWSIETGFRVAKMNLTLSDIKSKNLNFVQQDLAIHNFIMIVTGYLYSLLNNDKKPTSPISFTNLLNQFCTHFLEILIYKNVHYKTINKMIKMIKCVAQFLYFPVKNRHFFRRRVRPKSKWGIGGNMYKYQ